MKWCRASGAVSCGMGQVAPAQGHQTWLGRCWWMNWQLYTNSPAHHNSKRLSRRPKKAPDQDPQVEIFINEPSRGSEACTGALPSDERDSQGEAGDRNVDPCNTGLGQLVWPVGCADTQRNTEIGKLLCSMDPKYMTSDDPLCPQKDGGVGFWQALLTQPQIQTLRQ